MGEMVIRHVDDALRYRLEQAAARSGQEADSLARDMIAYQLAAGPRAEPPQMPTEVSPDDRERRRRVVDELRDIRSLTLDPLVSDSTLMIREMRDRDC